jgi:uncharacterized membrane protein
VTGDASAPHLSETARLETFCDGVFAIAITLLVLEIRVPQVGADAGSGALARLLLRSWPSYLGYVLSFVVIGIMWANHHSIFRYVRRTDRYFLLVNVGFLMCVAFLPFPTAVLAKYLAEPASQTTAVAAYSATLFVIALAFNAVWWYAMLHPALVGPHADREGMRTITRRYALGPVSYGVTVGLAFVNVWACLGLHGLLAVLYLLPEQRHR